MAKARWTTVPREVVAAAQADGSFLFSAPLLDDGVRQLVLELRVTDGREVRVRVRRGGPAARLTSFTAWSDL